MTYSYINQELTADEIELRLENNEELENFIPDMIKEGYDFSAFEEETGLRRIFMKQPKSFFQQQLLAV